MSMTPQERIARHRLSVLELAEALQNVSAACRQRGMTRTQCYDYQRRFELQGLEGLKDLPPIHKNHPQTTPEAVVERILTLSLAHPAWGCCRLEAYLKLDSSSVKFIDQVQEEDIVLCKSVQRGLRSGVFDRGTLMLSREKALRHFQKLVYRFVAGYTRHLNRLTLCTPDGLQSAYSYAGASAPRRPQIRRRREAIECFSATPVYEISASDAENQTSLGGSSPGPAY